VAVADGAAEQSELSALVAVSAELGVSAAALGVDADASAAALAAGAPLEKQGLWFTLAALTLAGADGHTSADELTAWREGCSQLKLPDPCEKHGIDAVKEMAIGGVRQAIAPALKAMPAKRRIEFILMLVRVAGVDASLAPEEVALVNRLVEELGLTMTAGPDGLQFADAQPKTPPDEPSDPLADTQGWLLAALSALVDASEDGAEPLGGRMRAVAREAKQKAESQRLPTEKAEALVQLAERISINARSPSAGAIEAMLGHLFEEGLFLDQDLDRALQWYRMGAEAGHHVCTMKLREHEQPLPSGAPEPNVLRSGGAGPAPAPVADEPVESSTVGRPEPITRPTPAASPAADVPPAELPAELDPSAPSALESPEQSPRSPERAQDSQSADAGGRSATTGLDGETSDGAGGSNPLSMASVGLGVLGTVCSLASVLPGAVCLSVAVNLAAIAAGAIGLKQSQETGTGKKFSLAGLALGGANILLTIVVCIVWFFGRRFF